jgi:hypothetical protein
MVASTMAKVVSLEHARETPQEDEQRDGGAGLGQHGDVRSLVGDVDAIDAGEDGRGGLMTLSFDPYTCPTLDCPDTTFDYLLTVRDAAGRASPVQRLRLIVTLFEL